MNPPEITETTSRKGSENPKTNEMRNEGKARTAASGRKKQNTKTKGDRGKGGPPMEENNTQTDWVRLRSRRSDK